MSDGFFPYKTDEFPITIFVISSGMFHQALLGGSFLLVTFLFQKKSNVKTASNRTLYGSLFLFPDHKEVIFGEVISGDGEGAEIG